MLQLELVAENPIVSEYGRCELHDPWVVERGLFSECVLCETDHRWNNMVGCANQRQLTGRGFRDF
ncbi:MAG: hypothetical protein BWY82_02594 [Verrucomicrobia bacterium ADurb.Bin474]|nr:MAG: hypothetical protein BWY82_02594 [Verrucomicrobia bacterium ADurb.Bin474]